MLYIAIAVLLLGYRFARPAIMDRKRAKEEGGADAEGREIARRPEPDSGAAMPP